MRMSGDGEIFATTAALSTNHSMYIEINLQTKDNKAKYYQ